MQASNIDQVISFLDDIVNESYDQQSTLAYFPILYRKVTIAVKDAIEKKEFEDNDRMEHLDVVFANRYLEAYTLFKAGQSPSDCWLIAFDGANKFWSLVLQQLLLGINAHINLDLGIAAAQIAPGKEIEALKNDFYKINSILSSMVEGVQAEINKISPVIGLLDSVAGKLDERIVDFSIQVARDGAWDFAQQYAIANEEEQRTLLTNRDQSIAWLARDIRNPGLIAGSIAIFIRLFESKNVRKNCSVLISA